MTDEERKEMQGKTDNWYKDIYLKSDHWRKVANERLKLDGYTCQMCGSRGTTGNNLEVHHWNYNYWNEDVAKELISLCDACHLQVHRLLMRPTCMDGSSNRIKNPNVPNVHVFTIAGNDVNIKLDDLGRKDNVV